MDGYSGWGRNESGLPAYTSLSATDLIRVIKGSSSARMTYADLLAQLTDELPDSILDEFSMKLGIGTWTASGNVSTSTTWQTAPFTVFGTPSTGISVNAGQVTISNPGFYLVKWRLQGNFTSSATIYGRLRSAVTTTPVVWPYSTVSEAYSNDNFTLGDDYLVYITSSDVIDLQFSTAATETYQSATGYIRITSTLPKAI